MQTVKAMKVFYIIDVENLDEAILDASQLPEVLIVGAERLVSPDGQ
jgi:hypothetical protein